MEEVVEEVKGSTVVIDRQPEFKAEVKNNVSATYFILCENEKVCGGKDIFEYEICGVSLADWVARACENKPVFLRVCNGDDIISLIRPYAKGTDYSVILYANTPLVNKSHLKDLLEYVSIKRLNVVKLTKGMVLSNEFIGTADEIFSVDTYDFSTNDLFEVNNLVDLAVAQKEIYERLLKFYNKSGVIFENSGSSYVDATVKIESHVKVGAGTTLCENSSVEQGSQIGQNCLIKNSIIGKDVKIGCGVKIVGSVIKNGTTIEDGAMIKGSVVGNNCYVGDCTNIINSGVKDYVNIGEGTLLNCARVAGDVKIGMNCRILGDISPAVILSGAVIKNNAEVVAENVESDEVVEREQVNNLTEISHADTPVHEVETKETFNAEEVESETEAESEDSPAVEDYEPIEESETEPAEEHFEIEEQAEFEETEPAEEPETEVAEEPEEQPYKEPEEIEEEPVMEETAEEKYEADEEGETQYGEEENVEDNLSSSNYYADDFTDEFDNEEPDEPDFDDIDLGENAEEEPSSGITFEEPEFEDKFDDEPESEDVFDDEPESDFESEPEFEENEPEESQAVEDYEPEESQTIEDYETKDKDDGEEENSHDEPDFENYKSVDRELYSDDLDEIISSEDGDPDKLHYWDSYEGRQTFKEDSVHEEKEELPHYWQDEYDGINFRDEENKPKYVKPLYWQDEDDKD